MKTKLIQVSAGLAFTTLSALAGDATVVPSQPSNNGDWCTHLKGIGKIYKDKNNPYIQEVKVFGRAHYQWGYTDGENNGLDFDGNGDEIRRLRFGTSVKFLNGFKFGARVNLEKGGFRQSQLGYSSFDELYLSYNFGDVAGFEDVSLLYGRQKVAFGGEEHKSSKKIKTVERSNINNILAPRRATGAIVRASRANVDYAFGVYTTDRDRQTLGQWNGGVAYYASAEFKALGGDFTTDLLFTDATAAEDAVFRNADWATSLTYETKIGNWDLFTNFSYGDFQGGSDVYGFVIMPSYELIEDKLEAVFRYQYAHSNGDIIAASSRNVRNVATNDGVAVGRGDENHTFYAGLNYFLCDHNAKVMVGVEYETLEGAIVDLDATTFWAAFRMYF